MNSQHLALITKHEQSLDRKITRSKRGPKSKRSQSISKQTHPIATGRSSFTMKPFPPKRLPKLEYLLTKAKAYRLKHQGSSTIEPVLNETFRYKILKGKPGAFNHLIRFLGDRSGDFTTIGLKNYYLKLLKDLPLTDRQKAAVRRLIWDYANSSDPHRIHLYCRLAIRHSAPDFHLAITRANEPNGTVSGWKLDRLRQHLDHHCPETKPK